MTRLAHLVLRRRRAIVLAWIALTLLGAYSANAVSKRWLEQFSIPGYSAYEANQRTLKTFGTGENAPLVAVFHSNGAVRKVAGKLVLLDRRQGVRLPRRAHHLRRALSAGKPGIQRHRQDQGGAESAEGGDASGSPVGTHRA